MSEYICKHCGKKYRDLSDLTKGTCPNSPTGKHQPFAPGVQNEYHCERSAAIQRSEI